MAGLLNTFSIISFILAVLFFVLAVIFWFVFKIPNVIGDLSGRNVRKSIANMRQSNAKAGNNVGTGLLRENLAKKYDEKDTGLLVDETVDGIHDSAETASLDDKFSAINRKPASVKIHIIDEAMIIHTEGGLN